MVWVYVLKLARNRWYVGTTDVDPETEYTNHYNGLGTDWTSNYRPQSMELVSISSSMESVRELTLELMRRYGMDMVRGYPWTGNYISVGTRADIQSWILDNSPVTCWICRSSGHLPSLCLEMRCQRCHRYGHSREMCGAARDRFSIPINTSTVCGECGKHSHSGGGYVGWVCPWRSAEMTSLVDDIYSSQITGVSAVRLCNGATEYCLETNGGNIWLRYSKFRDVYDEFERRGIHGEGFPSSSPVQWLFRLSSSTIEHRRSGLDRYFKSLKTRRCI